MKKISNIIVNFLIYHFPNLLMKYRQLRDFKNRTKKPTLTKFGFHLTGNNLMENGNFEIQETNLIKTFIHNVDIFINIGANIGYYCCFALQMNKKVIAFEPSSSNLYFLYKNMHLNSWENDIEIHPIALSNKIGISKIFGIGTGASLLKGWAGNIDKQFEMVPTNKLDNILSHQYSNKKVFVLIDVEGSEFQVLQGSTRLIENEIKPIWFVEISVSEHQPDKYSINPFLLETFELFWNNGYKSIIANTGFKQITSKEIKFIIETKKDNLNSHNFIFIDRNLEIGDIFQ